jgi:hypothetical protein
MHVRPGFRVTVQTTVTACAGPRYRWQPTDLSYAKATPAIHHIIPPWALTSATRIQCVASSRRSSGRSNRADRRICRGAQYAAVAVAMVVGKARASPSGGHATSSAEPAIPKPCGTKTVPGSRRLWASW